MIIDTIAQRARSLRGRSSTGAPLVTQEVASATYDGIPRMPALFGRAVTPRQQPDREGWFSATAGSTLATWVVAKADAEELTALLPAGFALREPLLIVEAITLTNLPWLAGRGYEMLLVSTPVTYTAGGVEHVGRLELVTWENFPDAILSGREELGWNKLYAGSMTRHKGANGKSERYTAAWDGHKFFELEVNLKRAVAVPQDWRDGHLFHYRVFPRTGSWHELEVEQVTANKIAPSLTSLRQMRAGAGSFRFLPATFEELPTLHHIVNRLAGIELGETVDAGQVKAASWDDVRGAHIISSRAPTPFVATSATVSEA